MKVYIAQITTHPGVIQTNKKKIIATINEAKSAGANLVVFPELALPGYLSMDLFNDDDFVVANKKALEDIAKVTTGISALVGFVDFEHQRHVDGTYIKYNSVAHLKDGKIAAVVDKTLLPTYDIFDEDRYFQPGRSNIPLEIAGKKVGLLICEDMWGEGYQVDLAKELVGKGANVLIDISASPFHVGKLKERKDVIKKILDTYKIPLVYVNLIGSFDGYEGQIVFDGRSLFYAADGSLQLQLTGFDQQTKLVDVNASPVDFTEQVDEELEELYQAVVLGIKSYFAQARLNKAFIGLSGGIDSALVAALAVAALGKDNVIGVGMPSQYSSQGSIDDARALAKNLGMRFDLISIEEAFSAVKSSLHQPFAHTQEDVTEENIQARIRGLFLMAYANKFGGLVISTGNKTELALGYCTLYGDMSGGIAAISDLSKLRVYALSKYINQRAGKELIPINTISKPPSAELASDQTDEESFGAGYDVVSPLVEQYLEDGANVAKLKESYPAKVVDLLIRKIHFNEYKRRQAAPGIRVTKKAFGIGRRVPIAHSWS